MNPIIQWLTEPSTLRGITLISSITGIVVSPEMIELIGMVGGAIYSLILLVKRDASRF